MPRGKKRGKMPVDTDGRFCYTDNMIKMRCGRPAGGRKDHEAKAGARTGNGALRHGGVPHGSRDDGALARQCRRADQQPRHDGDDRPGAGGLRHAAARAVSDPAGSGAGARRRAHHACGRRPFQPRNLRGARRALRRLPRHAVCRRPAFRNGAAGDGPRDRGALCGPSR